MMPVLMRSPLSSHPAPQVAPSRSPQQRQPQPQQQQQQHESGLITLRIDGRTTRRRVRKVQGVWAQWLSLLNPRQMTDPCGLWLTPCQTVRAMHHRCDVVFLRGDGSVHRVVEKLKPWEVARSRSARSALKLRAGMARHLGLRPGVELDLVA